MIAGTKTESPTVLKFQGEPPAHHRTVRYAFAIQKWHECCKAAQTNRQFTVTIHPLIDARKTVIWQEQYLDIVVLADASTGEQLQKCERMRSTAGAPAARRLKKYPQQD